MNMTSSMLVQPAAGKPIYIVEAGEFRPTNSTRRDIRVYRV
jgi:hypothetical protein